MIDIEKEHVAFEAHCKTAGYTDKDLQKSDDHYLNLHVQTVWEGWLPCAGSKQAEIDDLKAQINALEESRMAWREYAMKIESGEYELVKKAETEKCVWRENEFFGTFHTDCDNLFELMNTDSLAQNKIYYCPFCGKKIEEDFEESEEID